MKQPDRLHPGPNTGSRTGRLSWVLAAAGLAGCAVQMPFQAPAEKVGKTTVVSGVIKVPPANMASMRP